METQNTTPKKQKADLDLKIELPNSEKPFFNKMSTENNMISQIKKAGTKLGDNEKLNVSVNGTAISLSKADTQSTTLSRDIQSKLNPDREINKSNLLKTNDQEPNISKSLKQGSIKEYEGEYNAVFQKLWVAFDTKNNFYSTESLEYAKVKGELFVDADLTKWKPISNEAFSRIADEMEMKGIVIKQIIGEVSPLRQTSEKVSVSDKITMEDLKKTEQNPNAILGKIVDLDNKPYQVFNVRANEDKDHKYYLTEVGVTHSMSTERTLYKSAIEKLISNHVNASTEKNLDYLKDQIKYLGFGEDASLHNELSKKVNSDAKEFNISIVSDKTSFQNKASFDLQFNRSAESNNVFLNKFDARLINEKRNVDLQHTFAVKNNGFTAKQAINLLEGRSVKTEITNPNTKEKETAFVKLKLNEEKNEKGNFKLQVYNKNYGVDTAKIVDKSNLLFKDEKHKEITIKSLEKGNIVAVKMKDKGNEIEGKAVLNPQYKTLNLYDNNMKRLNSNTPVLEETAQVSENVRKQQHQTR